MARYLLLLLVFTGFICPSRAATQIQSVNAAQLGQWLTSVHGQSDGKIAKQIQNMSLVESVSVTQLAQWQSALPGHRSQDALALLADASNLLLPPSEEILSDSPPGAKTEGAILSRAVDYLVQTLPKIPDFYVTRTNDRFEDTPASHLIHSVSNSIAGSGGISLPIAMYQVVGYQPPHRTGQSTVQVSYRGGAEMRAGEKVDAAVISRPDTALNTAGEFGPLLTLVLDDAMRGSIEWNRWQQSPVGKLAVFHYSVSDGKSTCGLAFKRGAHEEKLFPAYSGEIAIDPATGAILRVSLFADSSHSQIVMESSIVIDYGPMVLGGKSYIGPVKSVALLKVSNQGNVQTQIAESAYTNYRLADGSVAAAPAK